MTDTEVDKIERRSRYLGCCYELLQLDAAENLVDGIDSVAVIEEFRRDAGRLHEEIGKLHEQIRRVAAKRGVRL